MSIRESHLHRSLVGLVAALSLLVAHAAAAQTPPQPVILVIDVQKILSAADAVRSMQQQLDSEREAYQDELRVKETQLREANQELGRQRSILSAEAFAAKRRELELQMAGFQREVVERKKALEQRFAAGMRQVEGKLIEVAQGIASERGATLILPKSAVFLGHPDMEISEQALKQLNAALPSVPLPAN